MMTQKKELKRKQKYDDYRSVDTGRKEKQNQKECRKEDGEMRMERPGVIHCSRHSSSLKELSI